MRMTDVVEGRIRDCERARAHHRDRLCHVRTSLDAGLTEYSLDDLKLHAEAHEEAARNLYVLDSQLAAIELAELLCKRSRMLKMDDEADVIALLRRIGLS